MAPQHVALHEGPVRTSLSILHRVFHNYHPRNFAVRLWDGTLWDQEVGQQALFTLVLRHPGALRAMMMRLNERTLGEAYVYDDFDIEGDIEAAFGMAEHMFQFRLDTVEKLRLGLQLLRLPSDPTPRLGRQAARLSGALHSKERDRQAVTYHYNVSNDFFALWLDRRMVYSCAYFVSPDDDLDAAQERKLEYICRKLRLHAGERLLDIGCGWGGLIIYAAERYGVTAFGITLSQPQADLANERIARAGLSDRCRVEVLDYRDLDTLEGYDKLVSIGMFEHVGESMLPEYFARAWKLLRPGGVFLNHGIAFGSDHPRLRSESFSEHYVFPDGDLVPVSVTLRAAEASGFEVRDVESWREHYMHTLRHWHRRLVAHHEEASRLTDEATYRIWRLMHVGSTLQFQSGQRNVFQTLLLKPDRGESRLPLTRTDWYR